ncbi:MAG TPA: FAD-dependent oxidoreductase [Caulobacteraceae bacterium]|nr:FAD-dependent oxidoreductase [Caulobacteraceae bacterium]
MRIAVVGSGVAGLGAAYALNDAADVVLYEKDARLGGHARTVTITHDGRELDVDTGFIVYNTRNYPNLVGLFDALGVESIETDMSFAFASGGLEWSSNFPRGVFAQPQNLANPRFLHMLAEIARFNRVAADDLAGGRLENLTIAGYLQRRRFGASFRDRYLLPMGAAIWSTSESRICETPAACFITFFANHNLLQFVQPLWRTVKGGSRNYVEPIGAQLGDRVRLNAGAARVRRLANGVEVTDVRGHADRFDHVVLACHSNQALGLLGDPDLEERALLGAVRYAPNRGYLHRDARLMPRRRAAWGSWNVIADAPEGGAVTYWMNNLQSLDTKTPLFVSLNPAEPPAAELTYEAFDCDHPQFDAPALAAQRQIGRIQGRGGVWYAGAWLGHGFHEDGLTAGLRVALNLGGATPWDFVDHRIPGGALPPANVIDLASRRAAA